MLYFIFIAPQVCINGFLKIFATSAKLSLWCFPILEVVTLHFVILLPPSCGLDCLKMTFNGMSEIAQRVKQYKPLYSKLFYWDIFYHFSPYFQY